MTILRGKTMKRFALAALLALAADFAFATKPCPPPPCRTPQAESDPAVCDAKADWIGIGHVTKLVHHLAGYPLNKDFTEFTFVAGRWIKGGEKLPREILFRTQWCTNGEVMQTDKGAFRFWGKNRPDVPNAEWEFLHFEKVEGGKK
jgi:hypothetical protein